MTPKPTPKKDKAKREVVDLRNQADQMVFSTRKQLEEHGDKVSEDVKGKIETAVDALEAKVKDEEASKEDLQGAIDTP